MKLLVVIHSTPYSDSYQPELIDGLVAHLNFDTDLRIVFQCDSALYLDTPLKPAHAKSISAKLKLLELYDFDAMYQLDGKSTASSLASVSRCKLDEMIDEADQVWVM